MPSGAMSALKAQTPVAAHDPPFTLHEVLSTPEVVKPAPPLHATPDVTKAAPAFKPPPAKTIDEIVEATVKAQASAQTAWPQFDLGKLKTGELVKLRDATMMYQPVHGSSTASRYFVVAANKDIRVAARWKGSALSIRIEGPGLDQHVGSIKACGFDNVNQGKAYASLHLEVGLDQVLASKALGAVLLGLGLPLETPIPRLELIKDKSN